MHAEEKSRLAIDRAHRESPLNLTTLNLIAIGIYLLTIVSVTA